MNYSGFWCWILRVLWTFFILTVMCNCEYLNYYNNWTASYSTRILYSLFTTCQDLRCYCCSSTNILLLKFDYSEMRDTTLGWVCSIYLLNFHQKCWKTVGILCITIWQLGAYSDQFITYFADFWWYPNKPKTKTVKPPKWPCGVC